MKKQKKLIPAEFKGILLILSAAVLWGTTGTSQAFAPMGSTPMTIGALRLAVGGVFLFIIAIVRDKNFYRNISIKPVLAAGIFVAAYQIFFFWGVSLTGVAVGTIVGIGSSPVFAGILGLLFLKEKLQPKWFAATICSIMGCALLTGSSSTLTISISGILLSAGAGLSYAIFTIFIKTLLPGRRAGAVTAVVFCTGAVLILPLLYGTDLGWTLQPAGFLVILHLGIIATGISYILFSRGLAMTQASTAVTLSLAEPVTAGILGVFVLGERLSFIAWCGVFCIILGLTILMLRRPTKMRGALR
ncbi:EamA family transporter [Desulfobacter hydrogenophilus]|uniref:EamA family transporter n=1 Tax=Desulfobacter hydrogenophilus TaxID=2291 RepID=A0A328FH69_9BACT|nr:DMT family transporter [Desulfobacter hydrogenophilus]NDY70854.1 EamA family transporter [Desulfobacter hydrogenophilus]QBH11625.1 EamA family transporter [Desulfobacter hydrogenophilus]RAM03170.1 EamA family transporter [Desulfobacter hydrogenophilus]